MGAELWIIAGLHINLEYYKTGMSINAAYPNLKGRQAGVHEILIVGYYNLTCNILKRS